MAENNLTDPAEVPTEDPRPAELRTARSLVVVNTGNGKGKTSAGIGMVIRAVAQEWPVVVVQFLKSESWKTGEEKICRELGVDWWVDGEGFTWESEDLAVDQAAALATWRRAKAAIEAGEHRLVMLDEITYPINWGWIDEAEVVDTITNRPDRVSIIVTGRDAPASIVAVGDTVSEINEVKHAYAAGIAAKKGIDY